MSPAQLIIDDAAIVLEQLGNWPNGADVPPLTKVTGLSGARVNTALGYLLGMGKAIDRTDDGINFRWVRIGGNNPASPGVGGA